MNTVSGHVAAIRNAKTDADRLAAEKAAVTQSPNGPTADDLAHAPEPPQDPDWAPGDDE